MLTIASPASEVRAFESSFRVSVGLGMITSQVLRKVRIELKSDLRGHADQDKSLVNLQLRWRDQEVEAGNLLGNAALHTGFMHNIRVGLVRSVDLWMRAAIPIYRGRGGARAGIFSDYTGGLIRGQRDVDDGKKVLNGMLNVATEESVDMHPIVIVEHVTTDSRSVSFEAGAYTRPLFSST